MKRPTETPGLARLSDLATTLRLTRRVRARQHGPQRRVNSAVSSDRDSTRPYRCCANAAASIMAASAARPGSEGATKAPHSKSTHIGVPVEEEEAAPSWPSPLELGDEKGAPLSAD